MAWSIALSVIRRPFILPHLLVAIHPLVGLGIAFYAVRKIIREIAAPKLELTMSLQSPSFAQLEWRIDEPDALASFEISLEASKLVHGGRSPRMLMEKSIPLCRQDAPSIPSAWRLGFDLPGGGADDLMTWLIVVRMKTHSCKRPYVVKYSLGGQF